MGVPLSVLWTQYFPPPPSLTEKTLPRQQGKVFLVTGGNTGIGLELCKVLYSAGAKVYLAARSAPKAQEAIKRILSSSSALPAREGGELVYLPLDLADLDSVKQAAREFQAKEKLLHVLFNNAGASVLPVGSVSKQGHELTTATNCLGAFLLTQLLLPQLEAAASSAPEASVRVIWTSSILVEMAAPKDGLNISTIDKPCTATQRTPRYCETKAGNYFLASEFARRYTKRTGIVSLTQNPGNLKSDVWRNVDVFTYYAVAWTLWESVKGAYTELWAGLSEEVKLDDSGRYVMPFGRWHPGQRADIELALRSKDEGGSGRAAEFWDWCAEQTRNYV
ncbi:hypothetical protein BAUCODRAFT_25740 [Baudoinia panamericana UAMH 10762]|uniref:Ketoreductase domain-containing protein n=1 Tax=Baudoinia panamericana (strain UAMH 10762) TaxID=717646 RepID=M2MSU6_BAUPA|nr:uncharacterized protein BAUCODRAFT_25740 [Baudoinia panamericana UAMH 10762]EMC94578.1 hypothetical protein BAUCODRAFT_25740 [Baudoinia panamericana UAMH 10762]